MTTRAVRILSALLVVCSAIMAQPVSLVAPVDRPEDLLTSYTTSWIGNGGGYEENHIPHDMLGMYVSPDGTVATVCNWDEGGRKCVW